MPGIDSSCFTGALRGQAPVERVAGNGVPARERLLPTENEKIAIIGDWRCTTAGFWRSSISSACLS